MYKAVGLNAVDVDAVTPVHVGPGCVRRDLPSREGLRLWIVDMEPGAQWPHVDNHDLPGEDVFVSSGVLIEGADQYEAGTFIYFDAHSSHQPRTDVGVRLFGINLR